jgi:hypothetical protein
MTVSAHEVAQAISQQVAAGPPAIEGDPDQSGVIVFMDRPFRCAKKFGLMPLIRFGYLSKKGLDTADEDALAAMYDVIRQAIDPDDWDAFMDHAADTHADEDELMEVVAQAIQVISARPTVRPSDSSDGPTGTETSSSADSSSEESSALTPRQVQAREHLRLLQPVDQVAAGIALATG